MTSRKHDKDVGRFAYEGLDRVLHEKARLGIVSSLVAHPQGLVFNDLKELCSLTDGNLSRHLAILGEAAVIEIVKGYKDNRPQTLCRLTKEGRRKFLEYVSVLESVVSDALAAEKRPTGSSIKEGWSAT